MNNNLVMLEGYPRPDRNKLEDGLKDYEQFSGDLGWGIPSSVSRAINAARNAAAQAAQAAQARINIQNQMNALRAQAMSQVEAMKKQAQAAAARLQAEAQQRAAALQQETIRKIQQQAKDAAQARVQQYINTVKNTAQAQGEKIKEVFPTATIQRAREQLAEKVANPKFQIAVAVAAAASAQIPVVGEKVALGIQVANAAALGQNPQEILMNNPELAQYMEGTQFAQLSELANNPTLETLQRLLPSMDAETAEMARAMFQEIQQYAGGVTEKIIENAFSIFDLVSEGKLF